MGEIIGGIGAVFFVGFLTGLFAWKRQPPEPRALRITMVAYLVCAILYGFGSANGGPFNPMGFFYYAIGAGAFYLYYRRHLEKHWRDDEDVSADTFR